MLGSGESSPRLGPVGDVGDRGLSGDGACLREAARFGGIACDVDVSAPMRQRSAGDERYARTAGPHGGRGEGAMCSDGRLRPVAGVGRRSSLQSQGS